MIVEATNANTTLKRNRVNIFKQNKTFASTLVFFVSAFLFLIIKILGSFGLLSFLGKHADLIVNAFIQIGLMFLLPLFLYSYLTKTKIKQTFNQFQFKYCSLKTILTSLLLGVFVYFAVLLISNFCANFWYLIGYRSPTIPQPTTPPDTNVWTGLIIPIITTAVLPGFCEEFANRGLLLNGLLNENTARKAILISAICFGLLHYNINQAIYAVFVGLVVGSLTYYTRSIFPAMIVHFTNNFLSTYLSWASGANAFGAAFNNLLESLLTGTFLTVFLKIILVICIVLGAIYVLMNEIYAQTRKNRLHDKLTQIAIDYLGEGRPVNKGIVFDPGERHAVKQQAYEGEVFVKMQEEVFKEMQNDREQKSFLSKIVPREKPKTKTFAWQNTFLVLTIFMTGVLTLFTLVWGFL